MVKAPNQLKSIWRKPSCFRHHAMREGQLGDTGRVVVTDDERQKENIDQRPFPRDGADGDGPCGRPHAASSQGSDFRFFFSLSEFRSSEAQASFLLGGVFGSVARFVLKKISHVRSIK